MTTRSQPRAALGEDGVRKVKRARWNAHTLPDHTIAFLDDLAARMAQWGERTFVTARQREWIDGIDRDLDRKGAPAHGEEPDDEVARSVDEVLR
ncbi:MAG: hypothetical protein OXH64_09220 [Rhodospirillaceae bacterium]|nr:hypothetical protein [Rhodospirillaceae bacterium]